MDQETEQKVRRRAYDLWLAAGKPEGSSLRFWKEAEAQVAIEAAAIQGGNKTPHEASIVTARQSCASLRRRSLSEMHAFEREVDGRGRHVPSAIRRCYLP